jgi:RNA recognition motif-containing protein
MKCLKKYFVPLFLILFLLGCGYNIHRSSDIYSRPVYLRNVDNITTEPGLQDLFRTVFLEEALNHGIRLDKGGVVLDITITEYDLKTVTVKKDRSVEYSVDLLADVHIEYPDGSTRDINRLSSEFMETFIAQESVQSIQAEREVTTVKALRDLSQRIIIELIY